MTAPVPRESRAHPARISRASRAHRCVHLHQARYLRRLIRISSASFFSARSARARCAFDARGMRAALAFDARSMRAALAFDARSMRAVLVCHPRIVHAGCADRAQRPRGAGNALAESGHGACALGWRGARDPPVRRWCRADIAMRGTITPAAQGFLRLRKVTTG